MEKLSQLSESTAGVSMHPMGLGKTRILSEPQTGITDNEEISNAEVKLFALIHGNYF